MADDVEPRAAGTCRSGRAEAPAVVVDQHPNASGAENPPIVDVPVLMPATTALTSLTAFTVGERPADRLTATAGAVASQSFERDHQERTHVHNRGRPYSAQELLEAVHRRALGDTVQ
ncbi:hypothetical protein [Saccharopolyspora karakumensis]|uniref:hypothetical protein n=1 Tax=Saccharopolyspora karakumensis TaxID=2530386 RepID=UPI00104AFFD8|nr:hypothetical protein [Saccharopolyspora karakumensis]